MDKSYNDLMLIYCLKNDTPLLFNRFIMSLLETKVTLRYFFAV